MQLIRTFCAIQACGISNMMKKSCRDVQNAPNKPLYCCFYQWRTQFLVAVANNARAPNSFTVNSITAHVKQMVSWWWYSVSAPLTQPKANPFCKPNGWNGFCNGSRNAGKLQAGLGWMGKNTVEENAFYLCHTWLKQTEIQAGVLAFFELLKLRVFYSPP